MTLTVDRRRIGAENAVDYAVKHKTRTSDSERRAMLEPINEAAFPNAAFADGAPLISGVSDV